MKALKNSIAAALFAVSIVSPVVAADSEVGALLRSGEWRQEVGSYGVPAALTGIKPAKWPRNL